MLSYPCPGTIFAHTKYTSIQENGYSGILIFASAASNPPLVTEHLISFQIISQPALPHASL